MEKKQKQVCDIRAGKGMTVAQSNEHLRIAANGAYESNIAGTLDPTRSRLNFEIGEGGVLKDVDKTKSIPRRIRENLKERGVSDPNAGLTESDSNRRRTIANIILQGSTETMRRLAFGNQDVNWERGADNSHINRQPEIEQWAIDMYNFMAKKYGEKNIAAFVVHLDESNPHVHCTLLPITEKKKFSWNFFFGGMKEEGTRKFKLLHDELAAINKRWGLERGDPIELTGNKHKSYKLWLEEVIQNDEKIIRGNRETIQQLNAERKKAETRLKGLTTMLSNLEAKRNEIESQIIMLEEKVNRGEIRAEEIEEQLRTLNALKKDVEDKTIDKKTKLKEAEKQLGLLADKRADIEDDLLSMQQQINKEIPVLHEKVIHDMDAMIWRMAAEEAKQRYEELPGFLATLSNEQRTEFNNIFEDSVFELLAEKANEVSAVAGALFLGYVDQATEFAKTHGGGGSPSSGWGKKEDEDDYVWRRRCAMMGMHMMKKGTKRGLKR